MRIMVVDPLFSTLPYDCALCTALVAQGHDVTMLARARRPGEDWPIEAGKHEVFEVADVFGPSPYTGWRLRLHTLTRHLRYALQVQKLAHSAARHRADVVHFQWCLTPLADAALLRRLRGRAVTVLTVHDTTPFNGSKVSSFLTLGLNRLMQRADHLIVHTRAAAETLMSRGIPAQRVSVVPHGLLRLNPSPDLTGPRALQNTITFLLFGHMKRYKGIDVLIRAVALLPDDVKTRCHFLVVGQPGLDLQELIELCCDLGVQQKFRFDARHVPDIEVKAILSCADVFVFPYREIQASGVLTLALQFGRPIIASNLGVFRQYISNGRNGFLVEPEQPNELASAISILASDPQLRTTMSKAGDLVLQSYPSWALIGRKTTKIYQDLSS